MKKLDIMKSQYLSTLVTALNGIGIQKEDLVGIYPPTVAGGEYTAIFYYSNK